MTSSSPALPIWVDDRLVTPETAMVSALDAGFRSGWGVFATMRAHGRTTLAGDTHLERLGNGARRLGIAYDRPRTEQALMETLAAPRHLHEVVARITITAGPVDVAAGWPPVPTGEPTLVVTLHPAPALPLPPAHAVTSHARRWPADFKSTSYIASMLATHKARAAGAEIAILTDGDELLETAEGNLFAIIDGTLVTPPDDGRMLAGVTRRLLLDAAADLDLPCATRVLLREDLARAETLAASSSVTLLRTILSVDGQTPRCEQHPEGGEHPTVVLLRERLAAALDVKH